MAIFDVIVVGAGGTGTFFLKEFSRFLYGNSAPVRNLFIIDGDRVEASNIARQAFEEEDIGRAKSAVMAEALNDAFNLKWRAIDTYVLEKEQVERLLRTTATPLIVGCVDNHACRLVLEEAFLGATDMIYLDSANEFSSGEVVFGLKETGCTTGPCRSFYFPDVLRGDLRNVTEVSCEELNDALPQHIATNMMAGNILLSAVCRILEGERLSGFVSFDAESFSSEFYPYQGKRERRCAA